MKTVTSQDGTKIAYDKTGGGPPVVLVGGALTSLSFGVNVGLAKALAGQFTVFSYDRRGRGDSGDSGDSGDTPAYSPQREIEDLEAVIDAAGGHVYLYGVSSGAVLALEGACALPGKVDKLVIYEPPVVIDDTRPSVPADAPEQLARLVAAGKRGAAVDLFLRDYCQTPGAFVTIMKALPPWHKLKATAHTLPYDETILSGLQQGKPLPTGRWASLAAPTLVISGVRAQLGCRTGRGRFPKRSARSTGCFPDRRM